MKLSRPRLRTSFLLAALPAAFAAVLLAGAQSPSQAGLLDDILSGPGGVTGPVLGGIGSVGCEQVTGYPTLQQGFCVLRSAGIKYRTTYLRPDGSELVRTVNGTVAIPSLLNVDDDLLPEATAVLTVASTDTVALKVDRALLEFGTVPAKVEVFVPMPGADPAWTTLYAGYDARQGRLPNSWTASARLVTLTAERTTLGFEVKKVGPAPRLSTVGGLFDGTLAQRTDQVAATIDPQPVPDTLAAGLSLGDAAGATDTAIEVAASAPTAITATLADVAGTHREDTTAQVDSVGPRPVSVVAEQPSADERWIRYLAADRLRAVRFTQEVRDNAVINGRTKVELDGVPTSLTYHQIHAGAGEVWADGGVDQARVSVNDRYFPAFPTVDGPHVSYLYDGDLGATPPPVVAVPNALDLRIDNLVHASFATDDGLDVSLTTGDPASGPRPDVRGYVEDVNRIVDATVHQFPGLVDVQAKDDGTVHYDGHGETVPQIDVAVQAKQGTLSPTSRYTRADATILALPPVVDLAISPDKNHVVVDAGALGVGSVRLHARDAASTCQAELADDRGAVIVDTPQHACLAARFDQLKSADVQVKPLNVVVKANHSQDLVLHATVDEPGDAVNTVGHLDGRITQMPAEFAFAELPGPNQLGSTTKHYQVRSGQRTPALTLTGTNLPTSYGNGFLKFDIADLAPEIDAYLPDEGTFRHVELHAPTGIGKVELELSKKQTPCLNTLGGESGVAFTDTLVAKCLGVRVLGARHATLELYPLNLSTRLSVAQTFRMHALIDDADDEVNGTGVIDATIEKLPKEVDIVGSTGTVDNAPNSTTMDLGIKLSEKIDTLDFSGSGLPSAFPARNMDIHVEDLWDRTNLRLPKDGEVTGLKVDAVVAPLKVVRVQLNDDATPVALDDDKDSVVVQDGKIGVLIHDLKRAAFQSRLGEGFRYDGTLQASITHSTDAKPLHVKVDDAADHITVDVPQPPAQLSFVREGTYSPASFTPDRPAMIYLDGGLPAVTLHIGEDAVSSVDLEARDIPDGMKLCLWSGGGTDHQVQYSQVSAVDPTWCYQPEKKPITQGGDPFTVLDTVQFKLSTTSGINDLDRPVLLDKLALWSKDSDGEGTTTITQGRAGLMQFAYGQGFIWGDGDDPAMVALYGGDDDNAGWDGVYDDDLPDREGLHFFADTDQHGFAAKLRYDWDPAGDDEVETTTLYSLKPLVAHDKITVLDMTGAPGEVYQRGSIGQCSRTWDLFKLVFPSGVTIVPETLADYLNCQLEPLNP